MDDISVYIHDSKANIEKCLACPYAECKNCLAKREYKKYGRGRPSEYERLKEQIIALKESGRTQVAIAEELHIGRTTLWQYIKRIYKEAN